MSDFAGRWFTTFGTMQLNQTRNKVSGTYQMGRDLCSLDGEVRNGRLTFRYREPGASGEGWFEQERPGKFTGQWRQQGSERWLPWVGVREFEGIWQSTFGPLRLFQEADRVFGFYEGCGSSTLEGQLRGNRLEFRYQEPAARGLGWFDLADDGQRFSGQWKADGMPNWAPWEGSRIQPIPNVTWLVVLEAHWQTHLVDREYAFGHMLREFFARVPTVHVRQRFFTNGEGLQKWCREIMYLAEPAILVIAAHGTAAGLNAHGQIIPFSVMADGLRYADNLQLLHFSSCLTMEKGADNDWHKGLHARFPISGYRTSVDWAASAMTEFLYLDMILSKGLAPEAAAGQVVQLLAFAGDKTAPGSPYPSAGFRFFKGGDAGR